jgi:hypothetical protein
VSWGAGSERLPMWSRSALPMVAVGFNPRKTSRQFNLRRVAPPERFQSSLRDEITGTLRKPWVSTHGPFSGAEHCIASRRRNVFNRRYATKGRRIASDRGLKPVETHGYHHSLATRPVAPCTLCNGTKIHSYTNTNRFCAGQRKLYVRLSSLTNCQAGKPDVRPTPLRRWTPAPFSTAGGAPGR